MENTTASFFLFKNIQETTTTRVFTSSSLTSYDSIINSPVRNIVRLFINCVLSPLVIIIGIVGNILTIQLFKAKKNKCASSIFILSLAASDLLLLITKFIFVVYILGYLAFPNAIQRIPVRSTTWIYFADIPERIGKMLTIGIMTERIFAVYFPLRLKQVWTKSRTKKTVAILVILILITNMPSYIDVLYFYIIDTTDHSADYTPLQEGKAYVKYLVNAPLIEKLHLLNILVFDLASIITIFVLCAIVSIGVKNLMTKNPLTFSNVVLMKRKRKERKITITMLTMSLLQCIFCGPLNILELLVYVRAIDTFDVPVEITGLTFLLLHLNSMVNFIIYGVADKDLRRRYKQQIVCCKNDKNKQRCNEYRITTIGEKLVCCKNDKNKPRCNEYRITTIGETPVLYSYRETMNV